MLEIKNLTKNYYKKKTALHEVNLAIPQGEIIGLFGENGAGKSTLMKCILGFLNYQGEILLDGEKITTKNIEQISFATIEHSFFQNLTAKEHEMFYKEHFPNFKEKRYHALMEFFHLSEKRKLRSFSIGQQNQFEVILALCQGAHYILMDEPFSGNDIWNREDFYKVLLGILEPDETVILSTHLIDEIENFVGRAILLHEGTVIGDVTADVWEDKGISLNDYLKEVYHYERDRVFKALDELTGEEMV